MGCVLIVHSGQLNNLERSWIERTNRTESGSEEGEPPLPADNNDRWDDDDDEAADEDDDDDEDDDQDRDDDDDEDDGGECDEANENGLVAETQTPENIMLHM